MFQEKVILVVDDEADLREILCQELLFEGAKVLEAAHGKEALEVLSKHPVDAVISDIRMPEGDGTTFAKEIRSGASVHPVLVFITGFADLQSEEAFELGADGYLMKPFYFRDLKETLSRLMKPPEQRWVEEPSQKTQQVLIIEETLNECLQKSRISLGRGGFFLQIDPMEIRMGDLIDIRFAGSQESIQAQVRWVRGDQGDPKSAGLGLEILQISQQALDLFSQFAPDWQKSKSFIPRN